MIQYFTPLFFEMINFSNPNPNILILDQYKNNFLSDKDFESLNKIIQLLNVSAIRYIILKFSIECNGNKTKLVKVLKSLFQTLRYDKILIDIYEEIKNMLSKGDISTFIHLEQIYQIDSAFKLPPNPTLMQYGPPYILGPITIPQGKSTGKFNFLYSGQQKSVNIGFLFLDGIQHQFELTGNCNGINFELSIDDPYPQPIDITDFLDHSTNYNFLNIDLINTSKPLIIFISEYEYVGIQNLIDKIVGRPTNIDEEDFLVFSNSCQLSDCFSLSDYLSKCLATGNWNCPICGRTIEPMNLLLCNSDSQEEKNAS